VTSARGGDILNNRDFKNHIYLYILQGTKMKIFGVLLIVISVMITMFTVAMIVGCSDDESTSCSDTNCKGEDGRCYTCKEGGCTHNPYGNCSQPRSGVYCCSK
jgi:hypothetical protein